MELPTSKLKETEVEIQKGWIDLSFGEAVDYNPKRQLKKGQSAKFVAMTEVNPFTKKVSSFEIKKFSGGSKFKNGDTLMARITPCLENGKTAFVDFLDNDEVAGGSTEFIVLSGKDNVSDSNFVYYLSISPEIRDIAVKAMTGSSGRQRVENDKLENYRINLPPLAEQKQIAEILSSLDDKIELNRKVNANLEKIASALFKHWFVDFEFPDKNGKPYKSSGGKMVESELGEIPEGWKIGTLGEAVKNFDSNRIPRSGKEREYGIYPYYGATSIMDYVENYIFDGTYVLLGEDGSVAKEDGKPFIQFVSGKIWVNNHAHVLQGKNGFLTEYLKVFLGQVNIIPFVTGAVQPKLNQANMNRIPMVIPGEKILARFNEMMPRFFGMILENESQIKNLEVSRDSLLPRLMSGKIRANKTI